MIKKKKKKKEAYLVLVLVDAALQCIKLANLITFFMSFRPDTCLHAVANVAIVNIFSRLFCTGRDGVQSNEFTEMMKCQWSNYIHLDLDLEKYSQRSLS